MSSLPLSAPKFFDVIHITKLAELRSTGWGHFWGGNNPSTPRNDVQVVQYFPLLNAYSVFVDLKCDLVRR